MRSHLKCRLARDGSKNAICLNKACKRCREWRCRSHCRCGREGTATGRAAARPCAAAAVQRAGAKAAPRPPQLAVEALATNPVGRPATTSADVFADNSWRQGALEEVAKASKVLLASLSYDDPAFQEVFLKRLRGRAPFSLEVCVDAERFTQRGTVHQRPRLEELRRQGRIFVGCAL